MFKRIEKNHLSDFGILDTKKLNENLYDNLILKEYRNNNMLDELKIEIKNKKFTYKDKIKIEYNINSRGFRSKEFINEVDVLTSGCSQTFGVGMLEEYCWPNLLVKNNNLTLSNISYPGTSAQTMVEDIFKYINEFGNPKHIRMLVPDFLRFKFLKPMEANFYVNSARGGYGEFINTISFIDQSLGKYEKIPVPIEKVMPFSVPFRTSLMHMKMLEQYCHMSGIDLKWTTWNNDLKEHFNKHNYQFKYYINNNLIKDYSKCHEDLRLENEKLFYLAADVHQHMGSHAHAHYAEILSI